MSFQAYGFGKGFSSESSPRDGDVISGRNIEKRKKNRRGKGKEINKRFSILLVNLRGYRSKEYSLKKTLRKVKPSMILMNETQLRGSMKVSLEPTYIS